MKKALFILSAAAISFATVLCGCSKEKVPDAKGEWKLVWNDEFSGSKLDTTKWDYQLGAGEQYGLNGWGNEELQYYAKENVYVKNGMLVIEARKEEKEGKPYTSGRIRTMKDDETPLYATTFGRVEAKIKMPKGDGIWPAFWMLPASKKYGAWAASGELDIMEARGRLPNRVYGTLHYGQQWPGNKYTGGMNKFKDGTICEFHEYAVEWEPGNIRWYVDGIKFFETSSWYALDESGENMFDYPAPYDEPFYILLNLAVGGTFDEYRTPSESEVPCQMLVDYVRVYAKDSYNMNVTRPLPKRDEESFAGFENDNGNYILDQNFGTLNTEVMKDNRMDVSSHSWYALALNDFGGNAAVSNRNGECYVDVKDAGSEVHSVQVIQHLGVAEGYTYVIEFDAKAEEERPISVKLGGDEDNSWAVYSSQYSSPLTKEYTHFKYKFTMEYPTDKTARLEFNVGKNPNDVWIKNVSVTSVEF